MGQPPSKDQYHLPAYLLEGARVKSSIHQHILCRDVSGLLTAEKSAGGTEFIGLTRPFSAYFIEQSLLKSFQVSIGLFGTGL